MRKLIAILGSVMVLGCAGAEAAGLPGRILLSGAHIDLYTPATGELRRVVDEGGEGVFFPSGREIAYIRAVGCFPISETGCHTEYSVFEKSLDEEPAAAGRGTFGPTDFFVRAVDVSPAGRLVFSAAAGPGPVGWKRRMEIYSAALDGSGVTRLTRNEAFDNDAVVSPDGARIAFSRRVGGRGQIFTMRSDGSGVTRVTRNERRNRLPTWSPDGRRLLFLSQPPGRDAFVEREIFTVSAAGGPERRLTRNNLSEGRAAYSPDGRSVAFLAASSIRVMGAEGEAPRRIFSIPPGAAYADLDWGS